MQDDQTFRVASYNIRKAIGGDLRRNPGRILSVVRALGADIVALQEADHRFRSRTPLFDAAEVTVRTGLTAINFGMGPAALGWHGNVVFVGPRVRVAATAVGALPGLEPRGFVMADLDVAGHPVRLVAAHLALFAHHRRHQVDLLARSLDAPDDRPLVVLGDLNAWGRAPRSLSALHATMSEVVCGKSFPARLPVAQLDRMFYRGAVSPVACGVWRERPASVASDHLPIWADLRFD